MRYTAPLAFALTLLLATVSHAQLPQALGGADPSQQLKTSGSSYNPTHPEYPFTSALDERPDPLITVIDAPQRPSRFERRRARSRTEARVRAQARARAEARVCASRR